MRLYHDTLADVDRYRDLFELIVVPEFPVTTDEFFLWSDYSGLSLHRMGDRAGIKTPLEALRRRASVVSPLAKAVNATTHPKVLDVMAGLGRDGFSLAMVGCDLCMVEKALPVWALADDCLHRHQIPNVVLHCKDGWDVLCSENIDAEVVYLDAMYPEGKKALPGKEMQYLRDLAGDDNRTIEDWLEGARQVALDRVVLKRRPREAVIGKPAWQVRTKKVRFDVYRPH
ncbi:MAG: class I SAM-dependent methyltransferase [Proteobacteria bacterium]|nr:class I SAM-dependent methyltransferase [Pseudomonadota bacterium]